MKLFIPGPTNVRREVLLEMTKPLIGHRTKEASELQKSISENAKSVFGTENEILLSTSSGTGLMEGTIRSLTLKKAAVFSIGSFGNKWYKTGIQNGVNVDKYEVPLGEHISPEFVESSIKNKDYDLVCITHNETSTGVANPIMEISEVFKNYKDIVWAIDTVSSAGGVDINVDKLGVDVAITSTQKCLALPPGMALATISNRALEQAKKVENRGTYFDLLDIYNTIQSKDYQYPNTPAISLMYALDYQLNYMVKEEGLENRYSRHAHLANIVRTWAKENFGIFAKDERYASNTVTCVDNIKNISVSDLNNKLKDYDMCISNGYGDLKNKTFRIAHMGDMTEEEVYTLLNAIDEILKG